MIESNQPSLTSPPAFTLHIDDGAPEAHRVASSVLVSILENSQRAFELIGLYLEGRPIKERATVPAAIRRRFQLVCNLPQPGSFAVPIAVEDLSGDLLFAEQREKATEIFKRLMTSVFARDQRALLNALPDQRLLRRVLEAVKGMAPRADAKWRLRLADAAGQPFAEFDPTTIPFIQETIVPQEEREASRIVTGELKSIDFAARKFVIIYPPTDRELECIYEDAVEDLLIENRRDLIQVTGRVLLDDAGQPKQIIDVNEIRDVDLSPLIVERVHYGDLSLQATVPVLLEPTMDASKQLLCVERVDLGIDAFAPTREGLLAELDEQLAMLWREYALADDKLLDAEAHHLKQALLSAWIIEVRDAA